MLQDGPTASTLCAACNLGFAEEHVPRRSALKTEKRIFGLRDAGRRPTKGGVDAPVCKCLDQCHVDGTIQPQPIGRQTVAGGNCQTVRDFDVMHDRPAAAGRRTAMHDPLASCRQRSSYG